MRAHMYLVLTLVCLLTLNVTAQTSKAAASYGQRGFEKFQRGDLDAAINDFTTAVAFDPNYARAYPNRAFVWYRRGRLDEALKDFNKTIELKADADAYDGRGNAFIDLGSMRRPSPISLGPSPSTLNTLGLIPTARSPDR